MTRTLLLQLLSFGNRFELLVDLRQLALVQPQLGDAALAIDRHRRLVGHGALDVIDADVIAEDRARIGLLDRCAGEADERRVGSESRRLRASPSIKSYWMRFKNQRIYFDFQGKHYRNQAARRFRTAVVISAMILSSVNCRRRMLIY